MTDTPEKSLLIRTLIKPEGQLDIYLDETAVDQPGENQVLVKVLAAPINPSDLGLLVGAADMLECESCGEQIGVARLMARPVAQLCIDCKTAQENEERKYSDRSTDEEADGLPEEGEDL